MPETDLGAVVSVIREAMPATSLLTPPCRWALKIVGDTVFMEYALVACQKALIGRADLGFKPGESMMRNTLAIALATVLVIGLTALADAKSQKACDIGCSKYTGGQKNSTIYTKCMAKCAQR